MGTEATLRDALEERRGDGDRFNMRHIVAMMVPLISELDDLHAGGAKLFVSPSSIRFKPSGASMIVEAAQTLPTSDRDRACIAPEERSGDGGDARSSVFAVGAVLYELATNEIVGPGMRRPSEVVPSLSQKFEMILGKCLVADRNARPADLAALAQALHQCAPMASMPPPEADTSHLDHDDDFEVDVSLSMLPPAPQPRVDVIPASPRLPRLDVGVAASAPGGEPASSRGSTQQLGALKARLESDPRPRYIVVKDSMDHGPFNAVELLQQIASGNFRSEHFLRDTLSQEEKQIDAWAEFSPFAEHAARGRQKKADQKSLVRAQGQEKRASQNKVLAGLAVFVLVGAAAGGWWFRSRSDRGVRIGVAGDQAQMIDFDTGLADGKKAAYQGAGRRGGGVRRSGGSDDGDTSAPRGPTPQVAGGLSCAGARAQYVERYEEGTPPDLTAGAYGAVLNRGTYLNSCGVPPSMSVSICAAVQNGQAKGVTVQTNPKNGGISSCISGQIRSMSFPAHPRLDITTTVFKAE
ncbi:MAG: hypothetical protein AAF928_02860 [Myxococcota bacterium]